MPIHPPDIVKALQCADVQWLAGQAPVKPRTSHGEMVNYYLKMEPHLFKEAVQGQFERIQEEREAARAAAEEKEAQVQAAASDKSELVLYR